MNVVKNKSVWEKMKPFAMDMKAGQGIYSIDEFKEVLKYERTRADRNDSSFSITLFRSRKIYESKKNLKKFINEIKKQVRFIDHIGWYDKGYIAALLPETKRSGAVILGNKVLNNVDFLESEENIFEIYTYPDNWINKRDIEVSTRILDGRKKEKVDFIACVESRFTADRPVWKKILDITVALVCMIISAPIFLLFPIYLKVVSPGPVFFHQTRVGYKGKVFKFWKFRTMHNGNSAVEHGKYLQDTIKNGDSPMIKLDSHDPRIIPGGKILRKTCIDELPQLINVLKGEMSLVGPRPCIPYEAEEYLRWHTHRFDVVPGMTGLWQVSGKNKLTFKQMIRLDIVYSKNMSLLNDLKIIFRTPAAIIGMIADSALNKISTETSILESVACVQVK